MTALLRTSCRALLAGASLALAGCSSLSPAAQARLDVFDDYVEVLADQYPFFAQKHLDWDGMARAYRSAVVSADRPSDFYHLLTGLLAELDDPHVSLTIPPQCWEDEGEPATSVVDLPGLELAPIDRRLYATAWPEGAEPAVPEHLPPALRDYPEITRVEGARVTMPLVGALFRGPAGSVVDLQLRWADGTLTRHTLRRPGAAPGQPATVQWHGQPVDVELVVGGRKLEHVAALRDHGRFAWLRLASLNPRHAGVEPERFAARLDELLTQAAARDGLVLDLRENGGGLMRLMAELLGRFLERPVELVLEVELVRWFWGLLTFERFGTIVIDARPPRFTRPVVVLTSWRTGSAAEVLARMLQREAGAVVVGEQTIGAEAGIVEVEGDDGTTLRFGAQRALDTSGVGFQDEGITPDVAVRLTIDDVRRCGSYAAAYTEWQRRVERAAERRLEAMAPAAEDR